MIVVFLLIVMAITRTGYISLIQDASWTVFFLVGFYLRSYIGLPIIILLAIIIDFSMIKAQGGHQDYYLSPSYLFIIPAYAALWFAGRFFANRYDESIKGLFMFITAAVIGNIACDLISSAGFFWMSAELVELEFTQFFERTVDFMPVYLKTTMLYLSIATIIHLSFVHADKLIHKGNSQNT